MASKLGLVGAWVAVTAIVTVAALAAVNAAGDPLGEQPLRPLAPGELAAPTTTDAPPASIALPSTTTTTVAESIVAPATRPPATTVAPASPGETTTPPPTPTTTEPPQSTTSTTTPVAETSVHNLIGGAVAVSSSPGAVTLLWATPSAGFTAEVDNAGPDEVRVEFTSPEHRSRFEAEWSDGELEVSIHEDEEEEQEEDE